MNRTIKMYLYHVNSKSMHVNKQTNNERNWNENKNMQIMYNISEQYLQKHLRIKSQCNSCQIVLHFIGDLRRVLASPYLLSCSFSEFLNKSHCNIFLGDFQTQHKT